MAVTGRPKAIDKRVLQKLEQAFAMGCSDKEACIYGGISPSTLYNYQQENKDFMEQKELLKQTPVLEARMTVIKAIRKDPKFAFKFLERANRAEFGVTVEPLRFAFDIKEDMKEYL